jgi:hypothetical protein
MKNRCPLHLAAECDGFGVLQESILPSARKPKPKIAKWCFESIVSSVVFPQFFLALLVL